MAPNVAISNAPMQTSAVPASEYRVKGSPRIKVANIVLKTSPDYRKDQQGVFMGGATMTDRLQGRKNWQRERGYLDRAPHDIGDHKHAHS